MSDRLTPEAAVRLLRAKGAELEYTAKKVSMPDIALTAPLHIARLAADIALVAQLLADHIEGGVYGPHPDKPPTSLTGEEVGAVVGEEDRNLPTAGGNASRNPSTSRSTLNTLADMAEDDE